MRKKRKTSKAILLFIEILAIIAAAAGLYMYQRQTKEEDSQLVSEADLEKRFRPSITHDGQEYPLKRNISSLVLIGTDNYIDDSKQVAEDVPYNYNMADFIGVLVFDRKEKTVTPIQICRDSMCEVETRIGLRRKQITMAHSYGQGREESADRVREALERLMYNVPLDNFMSFTMETVPLLNDLVGGVTITMTEDLPDLGYSEGETVTLRGQNALRFVRYRDTSLLDDNIRRMSHHRQYLAAFTEAGRDAAAKDQDLAVKAFKLVNKYLCTDLDTDAVTRIVDDLCHYELLPVLTPEGTYIEGEQFPEYILDEEMLWECVRTVFCE